MTKKHFVAIASALNTAYRAENTDTGREAVERAILNIAATLRGTNPRFDVNRFISACTGE